MFTLRFNTETKELTGEGAFYENERVVIYIDGKAECDGDMVGRYTTYSFERLISTLNGCFSIVLFDKRNKHLFLGRDRLGSRQLYYGKSGTEILISTHFRPCFEFAGKELNRVGLQHYFTFQYVPEPMTIGKGVYAVKLGHFTEFNGGTETEKRYNLWKPEPRVKESDEIFKRDIRDALTKAVKKSLEGADRVAAFLSGGLDSSIITAIAAAERPDMTAYTIAFDVPGFSEADIAKRSADKYGIKHEIVKVDSKTFTEELDFAVNAMGVPVGDPSAVAVSIIAKAAEGKCDVIFSGEGSDELWGGYHVYNPRGKVLKIKAMPETVKKGMWALGSLLSDDVPGKDMLRRGCIPLRDRYVGNTFLFTDDEKKKLLVKYDKSVRFTDITGPLFDESEGLSEMDRMQFIDTTLWLPGDINVVCGKGCSERGLNCVTPFMDNAVTDLARTLTRSEKIRGNQNKIVLREAFSDMITSEVKDGKKRGYPVPVRIWLSGELNSWAVNIIKNAKVDEFINKDVALKLLERCKNDPSNPMYYRKAWAIIVFCVWYGQYFETSEENL